MEVSCMRAATPKKITFRATHVVGMDCMSCSKSGEVALVIFMFVWKEISIFVGTWQAIRTVLGWKFRQTESKSCSRCKYIKNSVMTWMTHGGILDNSHVWRVSWESAGPGKSQWGNRIAVSSSQDYLNYLIRKYWESLNLGIHNICPKKGRCDYSFWFVLLLLVSSAITKAKCTTFG